MDWSLIVLNDNAKKWVEALRSEKYKQQTKSYLRVGNKFCCLGVACDLYQKEVGDLKELASGSDDRYYYNGMASYLPEIVQNWLGISTWSGSYNDDSGLRFRLDLASQNDSGKTFEEIADIIEAEPVGLFV
jgi:hypothetical protein